MHLSRQSESMRQACVQSVAVVLSALLHPLVFVGIASLAVLSTIEGQVALGLRDVLVFWLSLCPGLAYLIAMKRARRALAYSAVFLPLLLGGIGVTGLIYAAVGAPPRALGVIGTTFCVTLGATWINRRWNMSFHASLSMSCAVLVEPFVPLLSVLLAVLSVLVGLARLPIRQHTPAQVSAGWIYGLSVTGSLLGLVLRYVN